MESRQRRKASTALSSLAVLAFIAGASVPLRAQDSAPAPTPSPAPTRPLDDFRLPPANDGRTPGVQGPSNNGLPPVVPGERRTTPAPTPTPAPAPTVAPPTIAPTRPTTTMTSPTPPAERPAARTAPAVSVPSTGTAPDTTPAADAAAPGFDAPPVDAAPPVPEAAVDDAPIGAAATSDSGGLPSGWIALALAVLAAAGFWAWRRKPALAEGDAERHAREREQLPAPTPTAPPPTPTPPVARTPSPTPKASPVMTPGPAPIPNSMLALNPAQRAPSPLVTRPQQERRALVSMALDIHAITFTAEHVAVGFSLNLLNKGSADATGVMVRIALQQGSAMPESVLARFFDGAGGSVLRDDLVLGVGAGEGLATEVHLPRAGIQPLLIGGKPVLIPVLAFDVTYHWDGDGDAFGQMAGSFVLGREAPPGGSDKVAPLPLDRIAYVVDRPGARATAMQRSQ